MIGVVRHYAWQVMGQKRIKLRRPPPMCDWLGTEVASDGLVDTRQSSIPEQLKIASPQANRAVQLDA